MVRQVHLYLCGANARENVSGLHGASDAPCKMCQSLCQKGTKPERDIKGSDMCFQQVALH